MKKPVKKPATVTPPKGQRPGLNGGTLNSGGSWVNSGRPPSELRALARLGIADALPNIVSIAVGSTARQAKDGDSVAAFNALSKLGVPQQHEVGENPDAPMLTPEARLAALKAKLGLA